MLWISRTPATHRDALTKDSSSPGRTHTSAKAGSRRGNEAVRQVARASRRAGAGHLAYGGRYLVSVKCRMSFRKGSFSSGSGWIISASRTIARPRTP